VVPVGGLGSANGLVSFAYLFGPAVGAYGGGLLMVLGIKTRWIAAWYAFYCCFTAIVFHFVPTNRGLLDHFAENIALAGGFLILMAVGPGAFAIEKDRA